MFEIAIRECHKIGAHKRRLLEASNLPFGFFFRGGQSREPLGQV